ncbi:MAG: hypothetical protein AMXMBFR83_03550 [Phycisphaerae bacterium]
MRIDAVSFDSAEERYAYVVATYADSLKGRVLDVGCDQGQLGRMLNGRVEYVGTDVGGLGDLRLDLDRIDRLPFEDAVFDCVVCTDVLEHLDRLHLVFEELVRVCRGRLIISLPNCWRVMRSRFRRGQGTPRYYGLPPEPPPDRHKWFFNVADAVAFMRAAERRLPVRVVEFRACEKPRRGARAVLRLLRRLRYPDQMRYLNRYAGTLWTLLEKRPLSG